MRRIEANQVRKESKHDLFPGCISDVCFLLNILNSFFDVCCFGVFVDVHLFSFWRLLDVLSWVQFLVEKVQSLCLQFVAAVTMVQQMRQAHL